MVDLIEQSRIARDQLIDVTGRAVLQAVQLSAAQVAEVRRSRATAAWIAWFSMVCKRARLCSATAN